MPVSIKDFNQEAESVYKNERYSVRDIDADIGKIEQLKIDSLGIKKL